MSSADLIEALIKCQNASGFVARASANAVAVSLDHFVQTFHSICFSFPFLLSNFLFFLFTLSFISPEYTNIYSLHSLFYGFFILCSRSCTPTHWLCSNLFFYLEGQRQRFELHTVSILPSVNDLNKEFNTVGSE